MTMLHARRAGAWAVGALATALLAGIAVPAAAETLRDESRETYPLQPGSRVEITNVNGDLEFSSWDRDEALVEITRVVKARGSDRASRALEDLRIEVRHSPSSLEITTRQPSGVSSVLTWLFEGQVQQRVEYRVTLPRGARLEATTINGDVRVDTVTGGLEAETTNGRIELLGAAGAASASTTNGSISAEFVELGSGRDVELSTTNGGIVVYVPVAAGMDLSASTVNGVVDTDFAVLSSGSSARRRNSLRGAINGGGGQLTLETVNGSIELRALDGV
jgi:hypothetical protein